MIGANPYTDALYVGGNPNNDTFATPPEPEMLDLVGGIDHHGAGPFPTGYWFRDTDNLMFRMRVDNEPGVNSQFVWTVLINTDVDPDVDWALQLDLQVDNQVELVAAASGGPNSGNPWNPVVLDGTPHTGVSPVADYSRFVNASAIDGSHFHDPGPDDDDYFVDLAFPLQTLQSVTGLPPGFAFSAALATSADHININKDLPDVAAWSNTVPEPSALALLSISLFAWLAFRWRKRRG